MTGDAFGFVDPMLSPGLWLALHSAETLSENLDNLPAFSRHIKRQLKAWMEMISHYYSGRISAMYHKGISYSRKYPTDYCKAVQLRFDTMVACMACGATTSSLYGRGALKLFSSRAVWGREAGVFAVRRTAATQQRPPKWQEKNRDRRVDEQPERARLPEARQSEMIRPTDRAESR